MKPKTLQNQRAKSLLIKCLAILLLAVCYAIFYKLTGIGIPCLFHAVTKLYCGGCGITRMFSRLFSLDFVGAFRANAYVFCVLPFAAAVFVYKSVKYVKTGKLTDPKWLNICYVLLFVLMIVFSVLRNIPAFSFLAPH